jgi:3-deoxy-manno-octulosonate cytidylyltransferase (CMP-KDO synthetase)
MLTDNPKIGIVIPARLSSKRLPGKVLKEFLGITMIEHVWQRAQLTKPLMETVIATDSTEIKKTVEKFGAIAILTSKNHSNGLSRVGEITDQLQWDHYLILQADEILVEPESLDLLRRTTLTNSHFQFFNLITKLESPEEIGDVNVVKCLMREDNSIITMARKSSSIASELDQMEYTSKLCGLFSCSSYLINKLASTNAQKIEKSESIEQMKVIEMGFNILGVRINRSYLSVNNANDAISALSLLQNDNKQKSILNSYL